MSSVRAGWRMQRTVRSTVPLGYAVPPPSTLGSPTGSSSSWLFYQGSKPSADATHARGGIGQLHP